MTILKRALAFICLLVILLSLHCGTFTFAVPDSTVYVKKHVSLVYDNSGSMCMELEDSQGNKVRNLKWTYASYAAQAFAALLNDTDTLSVTFMENTGGKQTHDFDMKGSRQSQVDKLRTASMATNGNTPWSAVTKALEKLVDQGLLSDEQIGENEVDNTKQFWLVLTTDGVFETDNRKKKKPEETVADIEAILKKYSNLQVVYFGIGTKDDPSDYKALDLSDNEKLTAYPNFSAYFAQEQDQIVSTMQSLANRVSGRYDVQKGVEISGNTVTLRISGEGSPIRNVAILAQNTDASITNVTSSTGNLKVARNAAVRYPDKNDHSPDNVPAGTKGGYAALITSDDGKIAPGSITITFSEPVNEKNFSIMYEPAIYIDIAIETKDENGEWVEIPYGQKIDSSKPIRIDYVILEDGTGEEIDPDTIPGSNSAQISCGDEQVTAGQEFTPPTGSTAIKATVSLMDGAYVVTASRNITVISLNGYSFKVSDPLEFYPDDIASNSSEHIDFEISYEGALATAEDMTEFSIESNGLEGKISTPKKGVLRFTPKMADCPIADYDINLCFQGKAVASGKVTVKEEVTTYTATAGDALAIFSNEVANNTKPIIFTVMRQKGDDEPESITQEDAGLFRVEAKTADGAEVRGSLTYEMGGELHFIPYGDGVAVGDYVVNLIWENETIASSKLSVLQYDATFTAEVLTLGDGRVNRLNLRANRSGLAYIIYADGKPVPAAQLESMLSGVISFASSPKNKGARLEITVGEVDGKAAVMVVPKSKAKTGFGMWCIRNFSIAWGRVKHGNYDITMTLTAPKGTSVQGTLEVYNTLLIWLYRVLTLVFLALLVIISWVTVCNIMLPRIAPGTFEVFTFNTQTEKTTIPKGHSYIHKFKIYWLLFSKKPEKFKKDKGYYSPVNFTAQDSCCSSSSPKCHISGTANTLSHFYTNNITSGELINYIRKHVCQEVPTTDLLYYFENGTPIVNNLEDIDPSKEMSPTFTLQSSMLLYRETFGGSSGSNKIEIKLWIYTKTKKKKK